MDEPGAHTGGPILGYRVLRLFVNRESDEQDRLMFEGMTAQTYQPYADDPRVAPVLALGLEPLDSRGSITMTGTDGKTETVLVERITRGRTVAVLFSYRGYWHLWSMASAATETEAGLNEFTQILIEVIERLHPIELVAANVSRLVRSDHQANLLQAAMYRRVDVVVAGHVRFEFSGPNSHVGRLLFAVLAMMAAMERDWIVQRVTAGTIARWRRGLWPRGKQFVPFGYALTDDGVLLPRPELRANVRQMMLVLSSDGAPSEKQQQLARLGVMTQRGKRGARQSTVDALSDPVALERRLNACAAIWIQGEYLYRHRNPFRELSDMAGVPIQRYDAGTVADMRREMGQTALADALNPAGPAVQMLRAELDADVLTHPDGHGSSRNEPAGIHDSGELQMLCRVPVPEGGWAEPEVLDRYAAYVQRLARDAIRDRPTRRPRPLSKDVEADSVNPSLHMHMLPSTVMRTGAWTKTTGRGPAQARAHIAPLTGRRWSDDQYDYEINIAANNKYAVRRWPVGTDRKDLVLRAKPVAHSERDPEGADLP
ncbi:hypothetical protein ASH01_14330 [Terrabacter sp. Soil811]|nr:hypothetical protein ASH01_14330 [Terrabacter sp. Soil811]